MKRLQSIDLMRGIVMIIMALDHVRDLIHVNAITQSPTNMETTTPILFFTRIITHLCAPVFVFLAGTSAYISLMKANDVKKTRKFLLTRGIYLVILEFTVFNLILFFDPGFHLLMFEVIATIGFGFILLSLLIRLPARTIGIIGLVIMFCHNLLALIPFADGSILKAILSPWFTPTPFSIGQRVLIIGYPPIPWAGIMLVGFAFGKVFAMPVTPRTRLMLKWGAAFLILFMLLRVINVYGDPVPWSTQRNSVYTILSFFNITKYPPSLLFCLLTLGIMFCILASVGDKKGRLIDIVSVYGKSPLFYFLLHFLVIHLTLIVILLLQGYHWNQLEFATGTFGRPKGAVSGLSLGAVYVIWVAVVVLLYFPCRWYGGYKTSGKYWWLRYL